MTSSTKQYGVGLASPLRRSPEDGFFEITWSSLEAMKANLRCLLKTVQGSVFMDRTYGASPEKDFLFENGFDKQGYKEFVTSQVGTFYPSVTIQQINIRTKDDDETLSDNTVYIKLFFKLRDVKMPTESVSMSIEMNQY